MAFITALPQIISMIVNLLPQIISAIVSALVAASPQLMDAAIQLFNAFVSGIGSMFGVISSKVGEIPGMIMSALGNVGSLLWDAGSSIINGLLDGLKSAWDGVTGWFSDITSAIPNLKGPKPVDARLLVENGELIMGGFGSGLDRGFVGVKRMLSAYTYEIQDAFADGTQQINASLSTGASKIKASYDGQLSGFVNSQSDQPQQPALNVNQDITMPRTDPNFVMDAAAARMKSALVTNGAI